MSPIAIWALSKLTMIFHTFRLRSLDGASGHARERAWIRSRLWKYGISIVNAPWISRVCLGSPDAKGDKFWGV